MAVGSRPRGRRKAWVTSLLAIAVGMLGAAYAWQSWRNNGAFAAERAPALGHSAMSIVPGISLLGGLSPSAAYVVETSDGLILFDTGLNTDAKALKAQMAELGLDWRRVRSVFLTHAHGDHTGGANAIRGATGARVYAGAGDAEVVRAGGPQEAVFSTFFMPNQKPHPTIIDTELRGGEQVTIGDVQVEAIAAPGHTPGSICYLVERRGLRALFAGDVIMMLKGDDPPHSELDKPLGTYSAYLPPRYRGDAQESLATLQRLRRLPVPDLVLPGHPGADRVPQSPHLSQERWEALLDAGIRDMEQLLARYSADGADFLDGRPKVLLKDLYYLGDFQGSAVYAFSSGSRLFLVDAPGGEGLVAFIRERLRTLGREGCAPAAVLLTGCGSRETAGLKALIDTWHPQIVAAPDGLAALQAFCPPGTELVSTDDLPDKAWFPVSVVAVGGRGVAPAVYRVTLDGKSVEFTGRMVVKISQESGEKLIADLRGPGGDIRAYSASLVRLHDGERPDLWLPAVPVHGQNANLYDQQWSQVIEESLPVLRHVFSSTPRS